MNPFTPLNRGLLIAGLGISLAGFGGEQTAQAGIRNRVRGTVSVMGKRGARLMPRPAISSPRFNGVNGFIESELCYLLTKRGPSICHPLDGLPVRMGSRESL